MGFGGDRGDTAHGGRGGRRERCILKPRRPLEADLILCLESHYARLREPPDRSRFQGRQEEAGVIEKSVGTRKREGCG